jgi:hypothetical protein
MILRYCAKRLFPNGIVFRSLLEMDDIKFDGIDDIESSLKTDIATLKVKHRALFINRCTVHRTPYSKTDLPSIDCTWLEQTGIPPQQEERGAD